MPSLVVYHRGGGKSLGYPPNCIETIRWASHQGAPAIEFDVALASDERGGEFLCVVEPKLLILAHLDINHLRWGDLISINMGNEKVGRVPPVKLKQVLDDIAPSVGLQVHLKSDGKRTAEAAVQELSGRENVLITSFDLRMLHSVKIHNQALKVGWLVAPDGIPQSEGVHDLTKKVTSNTTIAPYALGELSAIDEQLRTNQVDVAILCGPRIQKREMVSFLKERGYSVGAWGIGTNIALARQLIDFGIDRFTIDNPEQM
ncbi:MAG: glycerophosphodiester phosphodiesterase [Candidatus Peregrinibacteria bacterium]